MDTLLARVTTERDALRAELNRIHQGIGAEKQQAGQSSDAGLLTMEGVTVREPSGAAPADPEETPADAAQAPATDTDPDQ